MNIVEVQDNLKNFSQDQLINEINQPSGMVPQFLVLTELGRRNRIKQDMEGRQAQNQPTVAQEVVSAAGVPQGGIMEMARSMAPKSSIEQNDGVNMMKEGGKPPRNRMDMLLAYLRSLGADEEEEVKEATGGKSIAEIINFGGKYRPVKKAEGGVVKMQQGTVVYEGKTYFTDGTYVGEKGASGRIVPVTDPEIVEAVTKRTPSATTEVGGIADISTNLDTFNPVSTGISPVNTPDPMFTLGNQMPPIAASEDKVDKSDLPMYDGGMPFPLVKDKNFTLKPYEGPSIGAFDATGTGSSENKDTVSNIPELTADTPIESPDLKTIFEGAAIQYPDQGQNPLDMESIAGSRRSTSGLPSIEAMENIGKLRSQQLSNLDTISNLPDFSTNKDLFRGFPFGPDFRESPQLRQAGALDSEQESLGADTFANLAAEQSLMDEGAKIAAAMDAEDKRLKPADKIDDDLFIDPNKKTDDPSSKISALESEIANMLADNKEKAEQDKWLALANAGLALMSSSNPTFGGAIGEAGQAGLTALRESQDQYNEDKLSLLALQQRAEAARLASQKKTAKGPKISDLKGAIELFDEQLNDILTITKPDEINPDGDPVEVVRSYDELTDAEKQRYQDILLQRRAAEIAYSGSLFGTADFDATK